MTLKLISPAGTVITLVSRPGVVESADNGTTAQGFGSADDVLFANPITFQTSGRLSPRGVLSGRPASTQGGGASFFRRVSRGTARSSHGKSPKNRLGSPRFFRCRPKAGQRTLNPRIVVRIHASEPSRVSASSTCSPKNC